MEGLTHPREQKGFVIGRVLVEGLVGEEEKEWELGLTCKKILVSNSNKRKMQDKTTTSYTRSPDRSIQFGQKEAVEDLGRCTLNVYGPQISMCVVQGDQKFIVIRRHRVLLSYRNPMCGSAL